RGIGRKLDREIARPAQQVSRWDLLHPHADFIADIRQRGVPGPVSQPVLARSHERKKTGLLARGLLHVEPLNVGGVLWPLWSFLTGTEEGLEGDENPLPGRIFHIMT